MVRKRNKQNLKKKKKKPKPRASFSDVITKVLFGLQEGKYFA